MSERTFVVLYLEILAARFHDWIVRRKKALPGEKKGSMMFLLFVTTIASSSWPGRPVDRHSVELIHCNASCWHYYKLGEMTKL